MPRSIRQRLDGNLPQFVEDVRLLTLWPALEKWGLEQSYLQVRKILLEETGNENFGIDSSRNPYRSGGIQGILREVIDAFADRVIRDDKEKREMGRQLEIHRLYSDKLEHQFADELTGLLESIKSE